MPASRDYSKLISELSRELEQKLPRSANLHRSALSSMVDGGSHTLRLVPPFPPRIRAARGAHVEDEDGHRILDFWQGHMGNVLGHNPDVVTSILARAFDDGFGLQTGCVDRLQVEVAEILCRRTASELVRLTTSGTLANFYAVMLARSFTGRDLVMKVGGGWHGAHPWSMKGIAFHKGDAAGYELVDTEGLPASVGEEVLVTGLNDVDRLRADFEKFGDRMACFVIEPMVGAGGLMPAHDDYLREVRDLSHRYGVVLIFDEVINGFRFRAGDLGSLLGVTPDLAVFGKAIGGGMPLAAFGGRADIMDLLGRRKGCPVNVSGGTYCAHPASLLTAKTAMNHLIEHEAELYPNLGSLGVKFRQALERGFQSEGVYARCTGRDDRLASGSSLAMVHFPFEEEARLETPEAVHDPAVCDIDLRDHVLGPALLAEGVHLIHGHGAVSTAHTDEDLAFLEQACRRVARRVRPYL